MKTRSAKPKKVESPLPVSTANVHEVSEALKSCTDDNTNYFHVTNGYGGFVLGKVLSVHDGDTLRVALCIDNHVRKTDIRMLGIDTPELMDPATKKWAETVRDFVKEKVLNKYVWVCVDCTGNQFRNQEKYANRVLGTVHPLENLNDPPGASLSQILIDKKYAKPYFGATKEKWTCFPCL